MKIDTSNFGGDNFRLQFHYPRVEGNASSITIELSDIRAANSITIKYDYDRDGWSILSDLMDPDIQGLQSEELHEVAFVDAWPIADDSSDDLESKAWSIYMGGLSDDYNFYADQADREGLAAVYKAGLEAGQKTTNLGPVLGDGDTFILNGEEYKARFIENDYNEAYQSESIRLVLIKEKN